MKKQNMKIIFSIDSAGVVFDTHEPIHLDSLLGYVVALKEGLTPPQREEEPVDLMLPLERSEINGYKIWHASALFIEGTPVEYVRFHRSRFRTDRIEITKGSPNTKSGKYRSWNMPKFITITDDLIAYARGDIEQVQNLLSKVKYIGKKRAHGLGKVVSVTVKRIKNDYSLTHNKKAMRWLPSEDGLRFVRTAPPYWHPLNRTFCCDVGDNFIL